MAKYLIYLARTGFVSVSAVATGHVVLLHRCIRAGTECGLAKDETYLIIG